MSRICQLSGKVANNGYAVSHSHRRTKKVQDVNLQWKRIWWPEGKRWVRLRLSTKALKTIESKGLAALAKQAGLNLNKL
jgi:large subunit ribosomal protein L28